MKIGITGHQHLGSEATITWLWDVVDKLIHQYHVDFGITSLAIGADQLFAEILRKANIPYMAIIPSDDYETTFQNRNDLAHYQGLIRTASTQITLPFEKANETAFYEAGKQVVQRSDMLFAIWDGLPAKGLGGTGDIVQYALSNKKHIVHINPITHKVNML
ncbi:hypothetical protein [Dictyobacter formicarum]|uniref:Uncharacterized protein n=1 Tax=Dictyobacter formicarum TaxID=2778368 RepID=A0ABQ3VGF8_9CHLR|nr:hypothetical protein [Dictyobacter formicarum]GHO85247.1 hypothetical protein KSZ_32530 [Dictyobacter formicarum]